MAKGEKILVNENLWSFQFLKLTIPGTSTMTGTR